MPGRYPSSRYPAGDIPMGPALAFIMCVLIWGSTWIVIDSQVGIVPVAWSVAYRFAFSALILVAMCLIRGISLRLRRGDHVTVILLGIFLFSTNYVLIYFGSAYMTSGLVAVAFSLLSFLNIVNARLFLKTPIQPAVMVAALLGVFGLVLVFWPEIANLGNRNDTLIGVGLCVVSTLSASFGNTVIASEPAQRLPLLSLNAWGMAYGALANSLFAAVTAGTPVMDTRWTYWLGLTYLAIFGTIFAFLIYMWLVKRIGLARAAYIAVLMPLVALTLSTLFEGYVWTLPAAAGMALVVTGNVIMIRARRNDA